MSSLTATTIGTGSALRSAHHAAQRHSPSFSGSEHAAAHNEPARSQLPAASAASEALRIRDRPTPRVTAKAEAAARPSFVPDADTRRTNLVALSQPALVEKPSTREAGRPSGHSLS